MLTHIDHQLIRKQCELQHADSPEEIKAFTNAYAKAKEIALDKEQFAAFDGNKLYQLIIELGRLTEPEKNQYGTRITPVSFANGSTAIPARNVINALQSLCRFHELADPLAFYTEFEKIHPFNDGNGRVGDLLWKMLITKQTGSWPEAVPPDVFGVHGGDEDV